MKLVDMYKESEIKKMVKKGMPEKLARATMEKMSGLADDVYEQIKRLSLDEQIEFMKELYQEMDDRAREYTDEFDKTKVDRIIIETTDKANEIIKWSKENVEALCPDNTLPVVFETGVIELTDCNIEIGFNHVNNNKTIFYIYQDKKYMYKFEQLSNAKISSIIPVFASWMSKEYRRECAQVVKEKEQIMTFINMFDSLMIYAVFHRETVMVDEPKRKSHSSSRKLNTNNNPLPLTPKRYIIKHIDKSVPGHHAAPEYQVEVRPTTRRLKSGKVVPVRGFVKYKDKPKKEYQPRTYKA